MDFAFAVFIVRFHGRREIDGPDGRTRFEHNLREPAGAASGFKHQLSFEYVQGAAGKALQPVAGYGCPAERVELSESEFIPLKAERGCIVFGTDKTGNVLL
jgi:hypothetical protein